MNSLADMGWKGGGLEVIDLFAKKNRKTELNYKQ
jgi:hypothetical protein